MTEQTERTRCEIYSRVVGFLSPVSQWNKGKRAEFSDRRTFETPLNPKDTEAPQNWPSAPGLPVPARPS